MNPAALDDESLRTLTRETIDTVALLTGELALRSEAEGETEFWGAAHLLASIILKGMST